MLRVILSIIFKLRIENKSQINKCSNLVEHYFFYVY